MDRHKALALLAVAALLAIASVGQSQTTYEDPQGRFVIDLPEGWIDKPVLTGMFKNDMVADFDADGKNFSVAFDPGISESRAYYPYRKARTVNTFLIALPVKVPR